ncbi:MAG: SpoIID/LytB domain-containing protein [Clostridia bacterium]
MKNRSPVKKMTALAMAVLLTVLLLPVRTAPAAGEATYVRVLLSTEGVGSLTIPITGTYLLTQAQRSFTNGTLRVKANGSSVTVSHSSEGELYTGSTVTIERSNPARTAGSMTIRTVAGNRKFLGHFNFSAINGVLEVVNYVPMSHYLYGVVGYEMSNDFPIEALKAQAIAAKGYALLHIKKSGNYDIGDTASDQVYKGYNAANNNVIYAVDSTMGEVLYYGGKPLQCYYAASNGGWMILPSARWGDAAYDGAYARGADSYDMRNPSTPKETVFIPTSYSEKEMGTKAFAFLDARMTAVVGANGVIPKNFHFGAIRSVDQVSSSVDAGSREDKNHSIVTVGATVRADLDQNLIPSPTPTFAPTPSPTPENAPMPSPTPIWTTPAPTEMPIPPIEGAEGYDPNWVMPSPTPLPEMPTPTPQWAPSPSPTPSHAPTPSPTPAIELTREIPVSFSFPFADMVAAGLYMATNLKIFYAEPTAGGFNLQHARYGHGIGMSQRGAQQMAAEGHSYRDILTYYYPGATLGTMSYTLPESMTPPATGGGATPPPEGVPTGAATGKIINGSVNLRANASQSASSLENLAVDTSLTLLGMQGVWYYVSAPSGKTGYVQYDDVLLTGDGVIALGSISASAVNYRTGPGKTYDAIGRLSRSTQLGIYGMVDGWYKIKAMTTGIVGFVSKDYVNITQAVAGNPGATFPGSTLPPAIVTSAPTEQPNLATPAPTPVPTATPILLYAAAGSVNGSGVNIRAGTSTSTKSFGKLSRNTQVGLYEKIGSWYHVRVLPNGQEGFMYAKYITLNVLSGGGGTNVPPTDASGGQTAPTSRGYINASGVNIRNGASVGYDSLGKLGRNTTVKILGSAGSWLQVETVSSKINGYVFAKYVTMTGTQKTEISTGTITARLNLRTAATTGASSRVLQVMPRGAVVTVLSTANGWCKVMYEGTTGYCISSCVRIA